MAFWECWRLENIIHPWSTRKSAVVSSGLFLRAGGRLSPLLYPALSWRTLSSFEGASVGFASLCSPYPTEKETSKRGLMVMRTLWFELL